MGGQGVVLAGYILGKAAAIEGLHVVQTQSYGAEARGSAAKSEVIISDQKIGFPMVRKCDVLVAMNQAALEKNLKDLKEKGVLLVNDDVKNVPSSTAITLKVPASSTAESKLKSKMYANVVILGALIKATDLLKKENVEKAIGDTVPKNAEASNIEAFRIGLELVS